ncbi:MAG: thioredoxin family protein [Ignavibacteriaceae bacterium]|nr:thioredoxin family protein [Ignavibacteriaceae bacterium]
MRTFLSAVFLLFLTTAITAQDAKIGGKAPAFSLEDSQGKTHNLSDFNGKYVVLEWINFDCPFVKKHYDSGNMQRLQKKFTEKGVIWLSVCSSKKGKQGNFTNEEINSRSKKLSAAPTAYLVDESGEVGKSYGAKTTPHMYVINPEGTLVYMGAIDDKPTTDVEDIEGATNYVTEALNSLMNGKEVKTKSTKAYGCSVKY